jgi:signal transduction histidine kinase
MRLPVAGMRGRLLSLVLLNVLALAVVGGVVYASFDRVQELARAMARDELARIVANATLERGLAAVNARIALLARSCRGASFDSDWVEFVAGFDEIERLDVDSGVAAEIRRLRPAAGEMISSCQRIRGALIRLQRLDERLLLELGALDTITARALVEQTLARRDLSHLDQIMLLISGFRETALLVGKQIASHVNGGDDPARLGALDMLEDLELRLQSFVAASPEMSNARARIAVVTRLLRFQAADLFEALARFDSAVSQTLATKAQIALLTTRLDQLSQQRTQALDADLERAIDGALRRLGLAAAAIVLLSLLLTGWIIRSGIQRPLTAILHQVDAIARGVPETRRMATRDDEWGQIQAALSQMRDDLARAVKTAQDASAAKSQFLAVMSHELRTPMNGIIGLAEILSAEDLDPARRRDYARTIAASGEALLKILNDILDLSKVEAGRLALDPASFCPATTLDEVRALFADMAGERNILLETAWQGPRRCYRADAGRIRQMLSNLVSNALKFTPAGSIRVVAREVEAGGAGDALLEFSVVDTGPGMTPKEVEILFLPFTRLDNHATRQTGGTGLGLSIVRMLAEQMGGNTGVESTPGAGARFWFTLLATPLTTAVPLGAPAKPADRVAPGRLTGHVLIAEDVAANRLVIEAFLRRLGLGFESVEDGRAAVTRLAASDGIDLVLMDCNMPELDGFEATREIRAREERTGQRRVPIVAMTARAFTEDRAQCQAVGMDDFLAKPLKLADVAEVLARHCAPARRSALHETGDAGRV